MGTGMNYGAAVDTSTVTCIGTSSHTDTVWQGL